MVAEITLGAAFLAGILSFLSPCVLPLIPGYLSFLSGSSLEQMQQGKGRANLMLRAAMFVVGFSLVFIALGASATSIGSLLLGYMPIFMQIAGVLIIIFGIHYMGIFRLRSLDHEKRFHITQAPNSLWGALLIGVAFAFGWTPCIGPILASILAVASTQEHVSQGILLLAIYSAGLGIPFLLSAYAVNMFLGKLAKMKTMMRWVEIISGLLMVLIGVLILTGKLVVVTGWLSFLNLPL
ncbi:cytochrome c biogenesis CcdA family protein [Chrysiogenes arsenatis]|uniref:cytochrome c biogenesis CcdA family protein n=1 Tax=Chrysiogenes arsenatis TaxID=309797 RepID=UPI000424F909|nr:cytochrome c biogenesis protein CcdA [Chrysiogenes arsenatis]